MTAAQLAKSGGDENEQLSEFLSSPRFLRGKDRAINPLPPSNAVRIQRNLF